MTFEKFLKILILICFFAVSSKAQEVYRIKGDFTVKMKNDSIKSLTMGQFFYDKKVKKIVYNITFPQKQIWVFADTTVYHFEGDSLVAKETSIAMNDFSIFSLAPPPSKINFEA